MYQKKRAPVIAISLTGAKKETVMSIPLPELNRNEGLNKLLDDLKGAFLKEEVDELFADNEKFEKLRRTNASMVDFIADLSKRMLG